MLHLTKLVVKLHAGGGALTNVYDQHSSGTTAFTDFADLTFSTATITANGAMIYNTQLLVDLDYGCCNCFSVWWRQDIDCW